MGEVTPDSVLVLNPRVAVRLRSAQIRWKAAVFVTALRRLA